MSSTSSNTVPVKPVTIYPRSVKGRFRNFKTFTLIVAYAVYFLLPWLRWERSVAPNQAILFDIPGRKFYIFDLVVYAQDIFWLAGFLVIGAFLLFFVTGILGRAFCGYFCFQTLWTDAFMLIERVIQGERRAKERLDRQPWNIEKLLKKGGTHLSWLLVGFSTGFTFVLYWGNAPDITQQFFTGQANSTIYGTVGLLILTTYLFAGTLREKVCGFMCPYARFQSAMFDRDTLVIAYDNKRGEGSTGRQKVNKQLKTREQRQEQGVGDCIDCGYCVQVCPTGIDIRNGLQLQCISCALCIDACDSIMDSLHWPRGLVRYSSENELSGGKTLFLKPKSIGYAIVLTVAGILLIWGMSNQTPIEFLALQQRQPLYVRLSDGGYKNSHTLKINNKTEDYIPFEVSMSGLVGGEIDFGRVKDFDLAPEESKSFLVHIFLHDSDVSKNIKGQNNFTFTLTPTDKELKIAPLKVESMFYIPK